MDKENIYQTLEKISSNFDIELRDPRINLTPNKNYAGVSSKTQTDENTSKRYLDCQTIFFLPEDYLASEQRVRGFLAHEMSHAEIGEHFSQRSRRWATRVSEKFEQKYGKALAFPFALYSYAMEILVDKNAIKKGLKKEISDLRKESPIKFWQPKES